MWHHVSKILRIDYPDPERMRDVMRSKSLWQTHPKLRSFYKRTGRVVAYSQAHIETLNGIDRARSQLGLPARKRQSAQLLNDLFDSTQATGDLTVVYNEDDGVLDWTGVMKSVRQDCVEKGAVFRSEQVLRMDTDMSGKIYAVITSTESIDTGRAEIILAAGPWIMQLLEASSIQPPPPSRVPTATKIFSFPLELSSEQWHRYGKLPVHSEIGAGT